MLMQCLVAEDWEAIKQKSIASSCKTLEHKNKLCMAQKYQVSNYGLLICSGNKVARKLDVTRAGLPQVEAILRNRTVKIMCKG